MSNKSITRTLFLFCACICILFGASDSEALSGSKDDGAKRLAAEKKEQNFWCVKASGFKKRVSRERDNTGRIKAKLDVLNDQYNHSTGKPQKALLKKIKQEEAKLENSKERVKYAEEDLSELEQQAHREGVPPGWLRCQFE